MRFLFRLDLSLHTGAGNFFGILIFGTKHGVNAVCRRRRELLYGSVYLCDIYACFAGMRTCLISAPRIRRIVTVKNTRAETNVEKGSDRSACTRSYSFIFGFQATCD